MPRIINKNDLGSATGGYKHHFVDLYPPNIFPLLLLIIVIVLDLSLHNSLNLDDEYKQYEDALRKQLKDQGIDGSLFDELERNDLLSFGIQNMKHRIAIHKQIKRLVSQRKLNQQQEIAAPPAAYQPQQYQNDGPNQTAYVG